MANPVGGELADFFPFEIYLSFGRFVDSGDNVEESGLPRPVRTDQSQNLPLIDMETEVLYGG